MFEEDGALFGVAGYYGRVGSWRVHRGRGRGLGLLDERGVVAGDVAEGHEDDDVAAADGDCVGSLSLCVVEVELLGLEGGVGGEFVDVGDYIGGVLCAGLG